MTLSTTPPASTALRCEATVSVAGPHPGCAEFAPPEEFRCGGDAAMILTFLDDPLAPWMEGCTEADLAPYRVALCTDHGEEQVAAYPLGADIYGTMLVGALSLLGAR